MLLDCVHKNVCRFTEDRICSSKHCNDYLDDKLLNTSDNSDYEATPKLPSLGEFTKAIGRSKIKVNNVFALWVLCISMMQKLGNFR